MLDGQSGKRRVIETHIHTAHGEERMGSARTSIYCESNSSSVAQASISQYQYAKTCHTCLHSVTRPTCHACSVPVAASYPGSRSAFLTPSRKWQP